ncbi:hypothetical protein [Xenorhabdus bakwenae]
MKDSITSRENTLKAGLLETWNATETPYPDHVCIHQLFEKQAEKTRLPPR